MKKYLIIGLSIISSLFLVGNVKAETKEFEFYNVKFNGYAETQMTPINVYSLVNQDILDNMEQKMVEYWKDNVKSHHPYYYISLSYFSASTSGVGFEKVQMRLTAFDAIPIDYTSLVSMSCDYNDYKNGSVSIEDKVQLTYYYDYYDNDYHGYNGSPYGLYCDTNNLFSSSTDSNRYLPLFYYSSNYDQPFGLDDTYVVKNGDETLFTLNKQDYIPTYKNKFVDKTDLNYVEVDLNSYPYIILSLKDYSKTEEFSTINYAKGQYCLTSVYNYGSTEKKDIIEGSKTKRCSLYYDNYTPIRTYVLKSDLKNNAVYYLKAYDTTKENKVKIDTSVFNIHYISEEEKDNPIITINGKKYTPKSYDELTDTATKSEDENYADGASEKFTFSDIFTAPLEFLKTIWNSITQFFQVINQFISLLPETLQAFLYMSFMLAIILGLIKIIL